MSLPDRPNPTNPSPSVADPLPPWKRALDLVCCCIALPVLAGCSLGVSLLMQVVSPGPVFFCQERVGLQGRRFKIYKFRTMRVGADAAQHLAHFKEMVGSNAPMAKLDARGDNRLIPGAWLIRASGLDELPQFINVLRGEMSVVGPRPCLPTERDSYVPWQQARFDSMPGLTGLWQVSGKSRTTFDEMIRLDIRYSETKSVSLDLWIMLTTAPAMLAQIVDTRLSRRSAVPTAPTWSAQPLSLLHAAELAARN